MVNKGVTIGTNSWDQSEFWLFDTACQLDEICESMNWFFQHIHMDNSLNKIATEWLKSAYFSFQFKRLLNKHIARR